MQRTAKVEPTVLFAQISKLVGDLWQMKRAQAQGMRADQIAASFHVHQYVVQTTLSAARLFDDRTLDLLLEMCIETDRLLKKCANSAGCVIGTAHCGIWYRCTCFGILKQADFHDK